MTGENEQKQIRKGRKKTNDGKGLSFRFSQEENKLLAEALKKHRVKHGRIATSKSLLLEMLDLYLNDKSADLAELPVENLATKNDTEELKSEIAKLKDVLLNESIINNLERISNNQVVLMDGVNRYEKITKSQVFVLNRLDELTKAVNELPKKIGEAITAGLS